MLPPLLGITRVNSTHSAFWRDPDEIHIRRLISNGCSIAHTPSSRSDSRTDILSSVSRRQKDALYACSARTDFTGLWSPSPCRRVPPCSSTNLWRIQRIGCSTNFVTVMDTHKPSTLPPPTIKYDKRTLQSHHTTLQGTWLLGLMLLHDHFYHHSIRTVINSINSRDQWSK